MDNSVLEKIKGSLIGGAVGDALGYPIEFYKPQPKEKIDKYDGKGIISDDTQMTLFTAMGLLWGETRARIKGISPAVSDCIYFAYKDWYKTQNKHLQTNLDMEPRVSWILDLPELNVQRAPGNTCLDALSGNKKGTLTDIINNSKGCGGVMRVAPIGLFFNHDNLHDVCIYGAEAGAITHGHPLGIMPCYLLTSILNLIVFGNKNIEEAVNESLDSFNENFNYFDKESKKYFNDLMNKAIKLAKTSKKDYDAISEIGEGWVAEETLAIAIYSCIKYSNDFEKAIVCSVNHGGDSDSTGAVTGNIIGAYLGFNKIPNYYVDNLELKDVILEISEDLYNHCQINEFTADDDPYWMSKYWYCQKENSDVKKDNEYSIENIINVNSNLPYKVLDDINYDFDDTNNKLNKFQNYMSYEMDNSDYKLYFSGYPTDEDNYKLVEMILKSEKYNILDIRINDSLSKAKNILEKYKFSLTEEMDLNFISFTSNNNCICYINDNCKICLEFNESVITKIYISFKTIYLGNRIY